MDERRENIVKLLEEEKMKWVLDCDEFADKILALLSPQWISVEEMDEYPTEEGMYLIEWPNGAYIFVPLEDISKWHGLKFSWIGPLPQPPKEEG